MTTEVRHAVEWAADEEWNPGLHDADTFARVDPDGFFVAEEAGERVGFVSCVRWGPDFAFLGFYIVRPDRRGEGIGHVLVTRAREHQGRRVGGIDAVVAQQDNYRQSGYADHHRTFRHRGPASRWPAPGHRTGATVSPLSPAADPSTFDALVALDARHSPADRPRYLREWAVQPEIRTAVATVDGEPVGWAVARPARSGWRVGPLLAPDRAVAEDLMGSVVAGLGDTPVSVDVPEPNAAGAAMALEHGMEPVFETARMYRGTPRAYDLSAVYGLTTLELG